LTRDSQGQPQVCFVTLVSNMPTLRFIQKVQDDTFHVSVELDDRATQRADVSFPFDFTDDDEKRLRWYLEDYLRWPQAPAPSIAERVEQRLDELGHALFEAVFGNSRTLKLWARVENDLASTRVEVHTDVDGATALPWELLRDPRPSSAPRRKPAERRGSA
jgi:hypothetical protein